MLSVYHIAGVVVIRRSRGTGEQSRDRKEEPSAGEVSQTLLLPHLPLLSGQSGGKTQNAAQTQQNQRELRICPSEPAPSAATPALLAA